MPLAVHELQLLIWNGNPVKAHVAPLWRPILVKKEKKISRAYVPIKEVISNAHVYV